MYKTNKMGKICVLDAFITTMLLKPRVIINNDFSFLSAKYVWEINGLDNSVKVSFPEIIFFEQVFFSIMGPSQLLVKLFFLNVFRAAALLTLSFVPVKLKLQHPLPPPQCPGHLNFWRLASSNSLPSGQKSRSNAPPICAEIPLLKGRFRL